MRPKLLTPPAFLLLYVAQGDDSQNVTLQLYPPHGHAGEVVTVQNNLSDVVTHSTCLLRATGGENAPQCQRQRSNTRKTLSVGKVLVTCVSRRQEAKQPEALLSEVNTLCCQFCLDFPCFFFLSALSLVTPTYRCLSGACSHAYGVITLVSFSRSRQR